jgi:hypothetical protein
MRHFLIIVGMTVTLGLKAQYSDSISVNFFLLDQCIVTANMTQEIERLYQEYDEAPFVFQGYFPNMSSKPEGIKAFMDKFGLTLPWKTDYFKKRSKALGAEVAPQVVIYDEKEDVILYSGRINDSFKAVGQRRRGEVTHDLENALDAIIESKPIETPRTQAVGCFINFSEVN